MQGRKAIGVAASAGAVIAALVLTPALAAVQTQPQRKAARVAPARPTQYAGSFTPAIADPRLAAEFARRGVQADSFRFTPTISSDKSKSVKVAVRARAVNAGQASARTELASSTPVTAITPSAYNLGVSIGWKRFALSGDVARVEGNPAQPGGREAAEVGVSYAGKDFTSRIAVGAERADPSQLRITPVDSSYSLDVGGSYRIARNLDVTGGVRYKIQQDRLQPLDDERRDSQAVYVGTAFRF